MAKIDIISPCNEMNQLNWGRDQMSWTAQMMQTLAAIQTYVQSPYSILGPDASDVPDEGVSYGSAYNGRTNWVGFLTYTNGVLQYLRNNFPHTGYVGWSHHNYWDIVYAGGQAYSSMKVAYVLSSLQALEWKTPTADRAIFLTEGGYPRDPAFPFNDANQRYAQWASSNWNYQQMKTMPWLYMWTNHTIREGLSPPRTGFYMQDETLTNWGYSFLQPSY